MKLQAKGRQVPPNNRHSFSLSGEKKTAHEAEEVSQLFSRLNTNLSAFSFFFFSVSGNLGSCIKEVKPLVMYDGAQGNALEPIQGKRA